MQVKREGEEAFELVDNAKPEDLTRALEEKSVRAAALHKPGEIVTQPSGAKYKVQADGSWRRL